MECRPDAETSPTEGTTNSSFKHDPLDQATDGIRLLHLKQSLDSDSYSRICCNISYVTFAEKPVYEALSYTWGDGPKDHQIYINGHAFPVGRNLHSALIGLRHFSEGDRVLWVDAVCIDQENIHEKNWQIRLMPFVYMRATTVVVWLGNGPSKIPLPPDRAQFARTGAIALAILSICLYIFGNRPKIDRIWADFNPDFDGELRRLCKHQYWDRVWIIQEIGLARRIQLYNFSGSLEWFDFIEKVRMVWRSDLSNVAPLRLQSQIEGKYSDSHFLHALIEEHRHSLCKDPRDHIYGFVGLAKDCDIRYPVDYNKTLYQVWKDTVSFRLRQLGENTIDILRFGILVQDILGGPDIASMRELCADILLCQNDTNHSTTMLRPPSNSLPSSIVYLKMWVVGHIQYVGPTYQEVISTYSKRRTWEEALQRLVYVYNRSRALEENDWFLQVAEDENLSIACSYLFDRPLAEYNSSSSLNLQPPSVLWPDDQQYQASAHSQPHLFLVEDLSDFINPPGMIGLAPPGSQRGDLVCQIPDTNKLVVFRKNRGIIGRAIMSQNSKQAKVARESGVKGFRAEILSTRQFAPIPTFSVNIDFPTTYLICRGTPTSV